MESKAIATVLKIAALATVAYGASELLMFLVRVPHVLPGFDLGAMIGTVVSTLLAPVACGLLLWFFPASLLNRISGVSTQPESALSASDLPRITLTVMGIWLASCGLVDVIRTALLAAIFYPEYVSRSEIFSLYLPDAANASAKVAVGLVLILSAKRISNWLAVRGEG